MNSLQELSDPSLRSSLSELSDSFNTHVGGVEKEKKYSPLEKMFMEVLMRCQLNFPLTEEQDRHFEEGLTPEFGARLMEFMSDSTVSPFIK
jgi:hypothetical protein